MATTVTIDGLLYTVRKLENGNIEVQHASGQYNPMHGLDTEGVHSFEVHPCQRRMYEYWSERLSSEDRARGGEGKDGPRPWWSQASPRASAGGLGGTHRPRRHQGPG